jgi:hypothetical protein
MRARSLVVPSLLLVLAACTGGARIEEPAGAPGLPDVVVLDTGEESLVVESDSGTVLASDAGEVTAPDGSRLYSSVTGGGATRLDTRDSVSGALLSTTSLDGALDVRVASVTGRAVAMMRPRPDGADPAIALPRSHTTIVVADPTGAEASARYRLEGNFEPEAFSVDDARLFLIQYLPPEAPSVYRVTFLELASGKVRSVFGRFKTPPERMPGVRLEQVFDPTSDQLYTLYSNQPSKDLRGYWSESPAYGDRAVTFVHVLNLRGGWAYCAGLPKRLWGEPAGAQAMAPSPDGRSLFVVDSMRGLIAELDTETMEVVRTGRVDLGSLEDGRTSATMSADGKTLYVASARDGEAVYAIDAGTLEVRTRWTVAGDVRGLALSVDGARLYAALGDRVTILDSSSGAELAALPFLGVERILHVATRAA